MPQIPAKLQQIELFDDFNETALALLMEDAEIIELGPNDVLFEQGDSSGDYFFVVLSGQIDIQKLMRNEEETVTSMGTGEYFGEFGLFADRKRMAGAVASGTTEVLRIPRKSLGKLRAESPLALTSLYEKMFEKLAGRFEALAQKAEKTQFWL